MKLNMRSIGVKIWIYFALFAAVLLLILWFLQTVFLSSFYEDMKIGDITRTADLIVQNYGQDDFEDTVNELAFKKSILIFVTDMQGAVLYASDEHGFSGRGPKPGRPDEPNNQSQSLPREYSDFLQKLGQSDENFVYYKVRQDKFEGTSLVYGVKLSGAVLYISSPLDPVDSTTGILRTQLIYVTITALLLSFVIAIFISKKLSRPITKITATAKKLGGGDYDIRFTKGDYAEIDELADTLNYATTELSKLEKLRRDLIANISHDFRTPLTMIKAYTEMIRDISGEDQGKRELHLSIIADEAERLSALVNDVLDLSLIQSGNEILKIENINVSELLKKILLRFEPIALHEEYLLESHIDHDLYVLADYSRLEQVFYNLIGNAINHSESGRQIEVKLLDSGGRIRFEVRDNGAGIPLEELSLIWERYYKTRKTHKDTMNSTGLGLSIVKNVLELHHAKYGVNSRVGEGSTFWFEMNK